eukprot:g15463.t1
MYGFGSRGQYLKNTIFRILTDFVSKLTSSHLHPTEKPNTVLLQLKTSQKVIGVHFENSADHNSLDPKLGGSLIHYIHK